MKGCSKVWEKFDSDVHFCKYSLEVKWILNISGLKIQQAWHKSQKPWIIPASKTKVTTFKVEKTSRNKLSIRFTQGSFIDNIWKCEINLWRCRMKRNMKFADEEKSKNKFLVTATHICNIFRSLEQKSKKQWKETPKKNWLQGTFCTYIVLVSYKKFLLKVFFYGHRLKCYWDDQKN